MTIKSTDPLEFVSQWASFSRGERSDAPKEPMRGDAYASMPLGVCLLPPAMFIQNYWCSIKRLSTERMSKRAIQVSAILKSAIASPERTMVADYISVSLDDIIQDERLTGGHICGGTFLMGDRFTTPTTSGDKSFFGPEVRGRLLTWLASIPDQWVPSLDVIIATQLFYEVIGDLPNPESPHWHTKFDPQASYCLYHE